MCGSSLVNEVLLLYLVEKPNRIWHDDVVCNKICGMHDCFGNNTDGKFAEFQFETGNVGQRKPAVANKMKEFFVLGKQNCLRRTKILVVYILYPQ